MSTIATHRTPISILQEVCVKKGITPIYELVSSEGPIHEPHYIFTCTVGPFSATSKGASKKKAKHQASYMILLRMLNSSILTDSEKASLKDLHIAAANVLGSDFMNSLDDIELSELPSSLRYDDEGNYIGQLQELCQKNAWPPPTYEFVDLPQFCTSGQEYSCRVRLWKWSHTGFGSSKKAAKRRAACELMESILKNNLRIPQESLDCMEEENLSFLEKDHGILNEPKHVSEVSVKVAQKALRGLWNLKGNKIRISDDEIPADLSDPCEVLEQITKSHKITAVYSYVNNTKSGKVYCLAQLSTIPAHVIKSKASSNLEEARQNAAARCIIFLKTMSDTKANMNYRDWFTEFSNTKTSSV